VIYKLLKKRSDLWVCVSEAAAADFIDTFAVDPQRVIVMHNPMDIDAISDCAKEPLDVSYGHLLEGKSIVHVGRFTKDKGQWHLIRAFTKVCEELPDAKLVFLGDGALRKYAQSLANELDLEGKVHFLGVQDNPFKFMSRATVLGFTSLFEGFPNALVEALICGAPIVATDCRSGPRELLAPDTDFAKVAQGIEQGQYGILTPPLDGRFRDANVPLTKEESLLAESLIKLLQDEPLRQHYRQVSRERIEPFGADRVIAKWMDILAGL
jgi:glycosyltransferase involved in cell wall biosynthesis